MKKNILKIAIVSIFLSMLISQSVNAYELQTTYKPINAPFSQSLHRLDAYSDSAGQTIMLLQIIAGALLYFAAPVTVIILVMTGFNLVIGGADSEKLDSAKKQLIWALLGLALIILSYSLVRVVLDTAIRAAEMGRQTVEYDSSGNPQPPAPQAPPQQATPEDSRRSNPSLGR